MPKPLYLLAILAVALVACTGHAPPEREAGAQNAATASGRPAAPPAPVATLPDTARPDGGRPVARALPTPRRAPRATVPPDPRIVACTTSATDKASLMACLEALKTAPPPMAQDGGPRKLASTRPPIINPAWNVPDWYLSSSGSNDNTCTTSGAPCKTWGELVARWETDQPILSVQVTVHILTDLPNTPDNYVHWRPTILNTGIAIIVGSLTTVATNTISGLTAKNRSATGAYPAGLLQANLGAGQAQYLLAVDTTRSSSIAWIDSLSGSTSTLTQPLAENVGTWSAIPAEFDTWANGDTVVLKRPPQLYLSTFDPVPATSGSFSADDFVGGFMGNVWVKDPTVTSFPSSVVLSRVVQTTETRFDVFPIQSGSVSFHSIGNYSNVEFVHGAAMIPAFVYGGAANVMTVAGGLDADVILHGLVGLLAQPDVTIGSRVGLVYFDNSEVQINGLGTIGAANYGTAALYGRYTLEFQEGAHWTYLGTPSTIFLGTPSTAVASRLAMFVTPFASAFDTSVSPGQWYPARAFDVSPLGTSIASGGFGGAAFGDSGQVFAADQAQSTAAPAAFLNAGTGISLSGCTAGPTCTISSTVTGGVSSVTGTSGVSCSPTTGAVSCSNTGATSVTGAGSTSCSPTTGAVTCTTTNGVSNGLTGDTTLSAHQILVGEGTSPIATVGGCSTGVGLVYASGGSSDPSCGPIAPAGGGTGLATLTAHDLLVGNGTGNVLFLAPSTIGNVATSNGTDWISTPSTNLTVLSRMTQNISSNVSIPATSTDTLLVTDTITVPTGGANILVSADFQVSNPDVANDDINLCVSTSVSACTSALFSDLFTAPPNTGLGTGKGSHHRAVLVAGVSAGTASYSAYANSNTQVFHVIGTVTLQLSN
ncbi:MAG TPA: hypothetical protein VEZ44_04435 [bacterium]|nr:hypothetical protein [bacterium]